MSPTLQARDHVLVWRYWPRQWLRHGQIVIVQQWGGDKNMEPFIKRIAGLPGDTLVTSLADLNEYLRSEHSKHYDEQEERTWHIPAGQVFVRGDHPGSIDSTAWGPVAIERISGVVVKKLARRTMQSELPSLRVESQETR